MAEVLSGQKTIATAGTELHLVAAAGVYVNCSVAIRSLSINTGWMYIGNNGSDIVSSALGYELGPGEVITLEHVGDLYDIMVDSTVNATSVCWLILGRH